MGLSRLRLRIPLLISLALSAAATVYGQTTDIGFSSGSPGQAIPGTGGAAPFSSSVPEKIVPGVMKLSLQDAVDRGLKQNLGLLLSNEDTRSARGEHWEQLSALLPHVTASPYLASSETNLAELGLKSLNGISIPPSVGPFSYFDSRAAVTQSLFDLKSINATHAASESTKSAELTLRNARDLVVLAVGYSYLQAVADEARIETAQAQVDTAQALFDQATDRVTAGTSPDIDGLRAKVELLTRQQQLIQAKNNFSIQKLTVARVIGLAPGQEFDLTDKSSYVPLANITLDDALTHAYAARSDYQAALADVRAAEFSRKAARDGYLPTVAFNADYGIGGAHPSDATQVMDVRGTLSIPLFQGGNVHGDVLQAEAKLHQSEQRLASLRGQIDSDVRTALFNLESSSEQVNVARNNTDLADGALTQSRDRFSAGVTDTVEVVQSQEAVASAHELYISSLYGYNFAKISLARALGFGEEGVKEYFKGR